MAEQESQDMTWLEWLSIFIVIGVVGTIFLVVFLTIMLR